MNAIGCVGLQLYTFGETVSIPFWHEGWEPDSFYDKICANKSRGLHTLCLLDIKMKEQTIENMMKRNKIFEPPRFMSTNKAAEQLLAIAERKMAKNEEALVNGETLVVGVARIGSDEQKILGKTLSEMVEAEMGPPLHSLIIAGDMHPLELEAFKQHS